MSLANFENLKQLIADAEDDVNKFYNKNNSAAGTRARGKMQDIKELAQALRVDVQATKHARKNEG